MESRMIIVGQVGESILRRQKKIYAIAILFLTSIEIQMNIERWQRIRWRKLVGVARR